jgi:hypothetical protein
MKAAGVDVGAAAVLPTVEVAVPAADAPAVDAGVVPDKDAAAAAEAKPAKKSAPRKKKASAE